MRRLLSLDYVLAHPQLPWFPTEPEKVRAVEALGIERRFLPQRVYRGAAGYLRRYFPLRLPVALDAERAVFVYADPGHETATALRSWGAAHRELWKALWDRGVRIEVVAAAQTWQGRRRCSPTGRETPALPSSTRRSASRSTGSSRPSSRGMTCGSKRCAAIYRAHSGEWWRSRSALADRLGGG